MPEKAETVEELRSRLHAQQVHQAETLEQLLYVVAHDFRGLLRLVRTYSQLLDRRAGAELDTDGGEFMGYILDGAQRMDLLLGDLLVYSHLFRPFERPTEPVDSEAVLESVRLNLDNVIRGSEASVTYDPLPKVVCEATHLTQLFRHLIVNALTFRKEDPPRVHISAIADVQQATFQVRDNGPGIEARFHDQIFEIFKRLHGRAYPGNGVGLAICKRIVDLNGGRIWVESEPDRGAVFHFTLPL
jgi:light-regulated signal transduction histidine kinase (bacteriophytochrome)